MRFKLTLIAALLSLATVAHTKMIHAPPRPPPSQVPPPPSLRGTVYHVPADGGDQTAFINGLGAVSGDTIFFDQGNHQVCGSVNEVAGVLYIGPTVTYPILGQNSRAVLDGCGYVGKFVPANRAMVYGLTMNNFDSYVIVGTSGHKFRNNLLDMHNSSVDGSGNQEWLCDGGDTNTVIDWNTFRNGSGINNGECSQVGSGSTNFLLTHNRFSLCKNDCLSPTGDATNEEYSYNVFDRPGQNCVGCGTGSAIESTAGPHRTYHYHHNYVTGERAGGPFCLSIINGTAEVDHNYCGGNGAAIEWDPHYAEGGGITRISIHRNYMDAVNIPGGASIFGPYSDSPGSVLADNRVLGGTETSGDNTCTFSAGHTCYQVSYRPGPADNPGVPTPPAAGAAP